MAKNYNRRYTKDYHLLRSMFYLGFLHTVVDFVFKILYDCEIHGLENLPKDSKKYIYTSNHVSMFDPPLVTFLTRKKIVYMAKKELFEPDCKLQWLVKRLGAFAVNRAKPELATFKTVKDVFATKDWSLGLFPQGGIFPYGSDFNNIKKGFAIIAKHAKADIVPIAISEFSGYPKFKPFVKQKIKVYIGNPISHELSEEEIKSQWCDFILKHANYTKSEQSSAI